MHSTSPTRADSKCTPSALDIREVLQRKLDADEVETIMTGAERLRQEGRQEGLKEGAQQGRQEGLKEGAQQGRAEVLVKLLTLKFGELPESITTRLHAATVAELDRYAERMLSATTMDEVFG